MADSSMPPFLFFLTAALLFYGYSSRPTLLLSSLYLCISPRLCSRRQSNLRYLFHSHLLPSSRTSKALVQWPVPFRLELRLPLSNFEVYGLVGTMLAYFSYDIFMVLLLDLIFII